jgi:hypothetical protein
MFVQSKLANASVAQNGRFTQLGGLHEDGCRVIHVSVCVCVFVKSKLANASVAHNGRFTQLGGLHEDGCRVVHVSVCVCVFVKSKLLTRPLRTMIFSHSWVVLTVQDGMCVQRE